MKGVFTMARTSKENLTIRMEPDLKVQATALFNALGMDLSTATGIFFRQALRCHGLPFDVKMDEPNAITYTAMEEAEKGEDVYGPFDSVSQLMEALND
jgi:DNA-damage-inducible protein J